ncbi:MAG: hypothetical protein CMO34_07905 [Verrucomicrobia bacterium]|nr:hypothetical protein [Verrucomicrobiota bacterium]|tara:strand:- start:284 stop:604 length:321 start_codon:yes stop_codon:yes gene_type:complete
MNAVKVINLIGTALLMAFLIAFVLSSLWNWFLVPGLGAPVMSIGTAYGLFLFSSALINVPVVLANVKTILNQAQESDTPEWVFTAIHGFALFIILVIGAIVSAIFV